MTIHSMTAFARTEITTDQGVFICELKSVNHRYLEFAINLNDSLKPYEMDIRELMRSTLTRGKIDCWMRLYPKETEAEAIQFNPSALSNFINISHELHRQLPENSFRVSLTDVLNWPSLLKKETLEADLLKTNIQNVLQQSLQELLEVRAREGLALHAVIQQRLHQLHIELDKISERIPLILTQFKERLSQKLAEYQSALQRERLEQELVLFTHKIDINEEADRIRTHLTEMERVLKTKGSIGRRADFLLQELNREVNTIGSKAQDAMIAQACVEMKVILEQIREQVQNVE